MIKRWSKGSTRSLFLLIAFTFTLLSVAAFLESRPTCPAGTRKNISWKVAQTKDKSDSNDDEDGDTSSSNEGFSRFFSSSKKKEKKEKKEKKDTESSGIWKSFSKWKESRKNKASTEEIENVSAGFKRLESARKRDEPGKANKDSTIKPSSNKTPKDTPGDLENDLSDGSKQSNPLVVAQKFVSNVISKKQKTKEEWVVVASKTAISPGVIVPITAAGLDLLLVASKDGSSLHCVANSCPHLGTPLEIGTLDRRPIEYPDSSPASSTVKYQNLRENYIAKLLAQDGCENCIVCPLHKTAFALDSGEVRGEWCPYPPVVGKMVGAIKPRSNLPVFDVRTKGKNIEVRLNTPITVDDAI